MGEAKRKREARARMPQQPVSSVPNDIKDDIAKVVRSFDWCPMEGVEGGVCFFHMLTGFTALSALGIDVKPSVGGMIFRAGPDQYRDVVAWCGAKNLATRTPTGGVLAHYYLVSGNDIVDFSVGDWKKDSDNLPDACFGKKVDLGRVRWEVELPDYFWGHRSSFQRDTDANTPALGCAWYGGCTVDFARSIDLGALIEDSFESYRDTIIPQIKLGLEHYALRERLFVACEGQTSVADVDS